jgi:hypothetical protein
MAFNIYFAGHGHKSTDQYLFDRNACRLFSFVNEPEHIRRWDAAGHSKLFVDSGAFSVAHNGAEVSIDNYINFINAHPDINVFAELDQIPYPELSTTTARQSAEKSWENYNYMMDQLKIDKDKLLPLYHFGESKAHLLKILNTPVGGKLPAYIGIGGRHGVSTLEQARYFDEIFYLVQNSQNPNVKIHVFGMTVLDLLERYPFYSADSTTWCMLAINGSILTKTAGAVLISNYNLYNKANFINLSSDAQQQILNEIEEMGYNYTELAEDYTARLRFNIDYFLDWAESYQYRGPEKFSSKRLF